MVFRYQPLAHTTDRKNMAGVLLNGGRFAVYSGVLLPFLLYRGS
jgi:hypothetical protein